ncbi:hypothetical protein JOQ06_006489, partial [Pogonophryne albipinna]
KTMTGGFKTFTMHVLGLVIPLLVMIVCYSRILPILVHRVVKLILSIVIAFFLFWAPYNLCLFLEFLMSNGLLPKECSVEARLRLSITVIESLVYTHCCLNPIIYAFVGQKLMKRALPLLRKCVPGVLLPSSRDLSDGSYRKSSASRSSEVTSFITTPASTPPPPQLPSQHHPSFHPSSTSASIPASTPASIPASTPPPQLPPQLPSQLPPHHHPSFHPSFHPSSTSASTPASTQLHPSFHSTTTPAPPQLPLSSTP